MASQFPPALKHILPYLKRANEIESKSPLVAYYCRTWAAQKGIELIQSLPEKDEAATQYLISIMDRLEQDKAQGLKPDPEEGQKMVTMVAMQLFLKADKAEQTGGTNWSTVAKIFYSSSLLMDVVQQFGEMPEELKDKQKYARWKASEIQKSLKAGITPTPSGVPSGGSSPRSQSSASHDTEEKQEEERFENDQRASNTGFPDTSNHGHHDFQNQSEDNSTSEYPSTNFADYSQQKDEGAREHHPADNLSSFDQDRMDSSSNSEPPANSYNTQSDFSQFSFDQPSQDSTSEPAPESRFENEPQPEPQQQQQSPTLLQGSFTPSLKGKPTVDQMMAAQKHAKYAVSALQFNDSETALKELVTALKSLGAL